jgi:hypothetical protein
MTEGPFGRRPESPSPSPSPPASPPEREPRPPEKPPSGIASQATWILGVALILGLTWITINTARTDSPGSKGIKPGSKLPPFAAPLATSPLDNDANVAIKARDGVPKACDVHRAGVFNVCDAAAHGPLVLTFLALRSERCLRQVDLLSRLRPRFPDVRFAAVAIRGDRAALRRDIRERRWTLPVAYDRDGAVANAYAVAVCPTITFARRGGYVETTTLGEATEAEIVRDIERIR